MKLADLVSPIPGARLESGANIEIERVIYDSRQARPGDLFVAVPGYHVDGHLFAAQAAIAGAAVAVAEAVELPAGTSVVRLIDTRRGLAALAAAFYNHPTAHLFLAGITGTDGKTTTTHLATHLLEATGRETGFVSTVAMGFGAQARDNRSGQTTMESPLVQKSLAEMVAEGKTHAVLEVTSHALVQERVAACDFDVVAFTNVGHDHLDFHPTWEDYLAAKAQLIDLCANSASKALEKTAILNRDDRSFDHLARKSIPRRWSYGMDVGADLWAGDIRSDLAGSDFRIGGRWGEARTRLPMPGRFNVYNALCAATIALAFEVTLTEVAECLTAFPGVRGRLESIALGQPFGVYVDFAHSAGSLAATLGALRPLTEGRLMVVFGSTARADHDRPGMGIAAAAGSDYFVISTDDPLTEDPAAIAQEVASGVPPGSRYEIILDRREAIRHIIAMARPGDLVLLAGKGHEQTMRIGDRSMPWNDRTEAEAAIRNL